MRYYARGATGGMEKITAMNVENVAREFIGNRHPRVKRILLTRTWREGGVWLVEGELWFKRAHFFTARRSFRLRISGETRKVTSYEENKKAK